MRDYSLSDTEENVKGSERMLFVAVLKHSPENCFGRVENAEAAEELREQWKKRDEIRKEAGVKVIGAYINPNEHTFYYILETDDYKGVSKLLGPPMLTHHTAKITPVTRMKEAVAMLR